MKIRPARRSDFSRIAALHVESWRNSYADVFPQEYLARKLTEDLESHWRSLEIRPEDVILVAEDDGIIGFVAVWCRPDPYIDNLHVKPSERSKGTGAALMRAAVRQLLRRGHRTAYLWAVAKNAPALRFYEKLGGVRTDRELKDLFGHAVPSVRVEWSDVSVICKENKIRTNEE